MAAGPRLDVLEHEPWFMLACARHGLGPREVLREPWLRGLCMELWMDHQERLRVLSWRCPPTMPSWMSLDGST